jgi:hypothetical protein
MTDFPTAASTAPAESSAAKSIGHFLRMEAAQNPDDSRLATLVGELSSAALVCDTLDGEACALSRRPSGSGSCSVRTTSSRPCGRTR